MTDDPITYDLKFQEEQAAKMTAVLQMSAIETYQAYMMPKLVKEPEFKGFNLKENKETGKTTYGDSINISSEKMYQQGQHYNKHGRSMGYNSKAEYDAAAKEFVNMYKGDSKSEIFEGVWNGKGQLNGTTQIVIRNGGKQVIIDKSTGQIIDFYQGTELKGLINVRQVQ